MTPDEFRRWAGAHGSRFPSVRSWLSETPGRRDVLDAWRALLAEVELADALAVTEQMFAGHIEHPDRWQLERLPQVVLREARRISFERRTGERTEPGEQVFRPLAGSMRQALEAMRTAQRAGLDPQAAVDAVLGPTADDERDAYHCPQCQDTGTVFVVNIWGPAFVALENGTFDAFTPWSSAVAACDKCHKGEQLATTKSVKGKTHKGLTKYDAEYHLREPTGDRALQAVTIVEWWKRRGSKPANFEPTFQEFNQR